MCFSSTQCQTTGSIGTKFGMKGFSLLEEGSRVEKSQILAHAHMEAVTPCHYDPSEFFQWIPVFGDRHSEYAKSHVFKF